VEYEIILATSSLVLLLKKDRPTLNNYKNGYCMAPQQKPNKSLTHNFLHFYFELFSAASNSLGFKSSIAAL